MIDHAKKPVQHGERHFSLLPDTWSTADEYRNRVHTDGSPDPFRSEFGKLALPGRYYDCQNSICRTSG